MSNCTLNVECSARAGKEEEGAESSKTRRASIETCRTFDTQSPYKSSNMGRLCMRSWSDRCEKAALQKCENRFCSGVYLFRGGIYHIFANDFHIAHSTSKSRYYYFIVVWVGVRAYVCARCWVLLFVYLGEVMHIKLLMSQLEFWKWYSYCHTCLMHVFERHAVCVNVSRSQKIVISILLINIIKTHENYCTPSI